MKEAKGHVQIAFEKREGMGMLEWLVAHGREMTYTEAYLFIGYDCPKALAAKVRNHLPGFRFHKRPRVYTADAIAHCAPDVAADWLDGWAEARGEHMHLRASAAGHKLNQIAACSTPM